MFHRDASRSRVRRVHLIAVVAVVAAAGFSGRGWALDAGSPPAGQSGPASPEYQTLNIICRAADLPHANLPADRLPAEWFLSPADAKNTVDAIQKVAKTQKTVCSGAAFAPRKVLKIVRGAGSGVDPIGNGGGVDPIGGPGNTPDRVIRDVFYQSSRMSKQ
jgi:hypothetical protein